MRINLLKKRRQKQSGQAILEYVVLLTIVLTMLVLFLKTMGSSYDKTSLRMGATVEKQLRTGAAPAKLWNK